MKSRTLIIIIILALVVGVAWVIFKNAEKSPLFTNQTISDGTITLRFSSEEFGLATNPTQILVQANIPPCDQDFDYCVYYIGDTYQGTNFNSAGIRVKNRTDLTAERLCLDTPPSGYDVNNKPTATMFNNEYSTSVFAGLGDAAMGHYSSGSLYRYFFRSNSHCYELETRVGESRYENYPEGTIGKFTAEDKATLEAKMKEVVEGIVI